MYVSIEASFALSSIIMFASRVKHDVCICVVFLFEIKMINKCKENTLAQTTYNGGPVKGNNIHKKKSPHSALDLRRLIRLVLRP